MTQPLRSYDSYSVGIICALATEKAAVEAMLDAKHTKLPKVAGDDNFYTLGKIGVHHVAIACLPAGVTGKVSATAVAKDMMRSFPIKIGLMVGVGGGVWSKTVDMRLGDVVISQPNGMHGGVVQWDFGKMEKEGVFRRTGTLNKPPRVLLNALQELQVKHKMQGSTLCTHLAKMASEQPYMANEYMYQGAENDRLFEADYHHANGETCNGCDAVKLVERVPARTDDSPRIFYGIIASGDEVMKDGVTRDRIAKEEGVICFEMEAAGLMENFPCVAIRGICDYADSHKNKRWQPYAAATAAACAKELLEHIDKQRVDELRPAKAVYSPLLDIPSSHVDHFVGRSDLLGSIVSESDTPIIFGRPKVIILLGLGGQGKSQLALEYCRRAKQIGNYRAMFWINASSEATVSQAFDSIAARLDESTTQQLADPAAKLSFAKNILATWTERWLLVFDNYDQPNTFKNIKDFIPLGGSGTVIITSRHRGTARLGKVVEVQALSETEAIELLLHQSRHDPTEANISEATSIVKTLGFLALAIDQAGAFISAQVLPLSYFTEIYEERKKQILEYTPSLWDYQKSVSNIEGETSLSAFTTWEMSFSLISGNTDERSAKGHLLTISAFLDSLHLSEDIYQCYIEKADSEQEWISVFKRAGRWDRFNFHQAISELGNLSLLQEFVFESGSFRFSLHPLIKDWLKLRVDLPSQQQYTREAGILVATFIDEHEANLPVGTSQRLLLHIIACLSNQENFLKGEPLRKDASLLAVLNTFARFCTHHQRFNEGEMIFLRLLQELKRETELERSEALSVMHNLGLLYHSRGNLDEAEKMWKRVLDGYEKALPLDHTDTLAVVQNLGLVYYSRGNLDEAEKMWKRALDGYEKALSLDYTATLAVVQNLGMLYHSRGNLDKAEKMWERALDGYEKILPLDYTGTLAVVQNLGLLYHNRGDLNEAEKMWKRALDGYEKALPPDHTDALRAVQKLGLLYYSRGNLDEAEKMWKRALDGYEKALPPDHTDTLRVVQNLGAIYHNRGDLNEAEKMWKRALDGYENALPLDHTDTLGIVQNLGMLYYSRGNLDEAEKMLKWALDRYEKTLPPDHTGTLAVVQNLGLLYHNRGDLNEAEKMWKWALDGYEKALPLDHTDTLRVVQNLGMLYYSRGNLDEAEKMWKRALDGYEKALPLDHTDTLAVVQNLGLLYGSRGNLDEAEMMSKGALDGYEKTLLPDHTDTLRNV